MSKHGEQVKTLTVHDMRDGYLSAIAMVLSHGETVAPRGLETKEILGFHMELLDPTKALAVGVGRRLHAGVAAAEALQLVGGFSDPAAMLQISPHFEKFLDGGVLHAPYGPRILGQMPLAIERLKRDPSTRQAVVTMWDPVQDLLVEGSRDLPCTTHLQFMIRNGALDLHCSMRANDAWHGFPYDVFQFTFLQCTVAKFLRINIGTYYHSATSFHLYQPQYEAAEALDFEMSAGERIITGIEPPIQAKTPWSRVVADARGLFYGTYVPVNDGEKYLSAALRKSGVTGSW